MSNSKNSAASDKVQKPENGLKKNGATAATAMPKEIGGPKGLEPTRYGDWEQKGRCTDF